MTTLHRTCIATLALLALGVSVRERCSLSAQKRRERCSVAPGSAGCRLAVALEAAGSRCRE
jgi:hypothetical protein